VLCSLTSTLPWPMVLSEARCSLPLWTFHMTLITISSLVRTGLIICYQALSESIIEWCILFVFVPILCQHFSRHNSTAYVQWQLLYVFLFFLLPFFRSFICSINVVHVVWLTSAPGKFFYLCIVHYICSYLLGNIFLLFYYNYLHNISLRFVHIWVLGATDRYDICVIWCQITG
jgi:hypothetical protein